MVTIFFNEPHSIDEVVDIINSKRREYKDEWVSFCGEIEGKNLSGKIFNKHIQVLKVNNKHAGGVYADTVKQFKEEIRTALIRG